MAIREVSQRAIGVVVLVPAEEVIRACCAGGAAGVGVWAGGVVFGVGAIAVVTCHVVWFLRGNKEDENGILGLGIWEREIGAYESV
jgi:hypothetical protein